MPVFYWMNNPPDADTLDVPEGIVIAATDGGDSEFTIEVYDVAILAAYAVGQQAGVDIAPFPDGADDFGVEGTIEFYGLDMTPVNDAAVGESA